MLDFDDAPLSGDTYAALRRRLEALSSATLTRMGVSALYAPEALCGQFERAGLRATALPRAFADPTNRIVAASTHVRAGDMKLTLTAHGRASTTGLGGALTFRVSDSLRDNALRAALVVGVVAALEETNYLAPAYARPIYFNNRTDPIDLAVRWVGLLGSPIRRRRTSCAGIRASCCPHELRAKIDEIAVREDRSRSWVIEQASAAFVETQPPLPAAQVEAA